MSPWITKWLVKSSKRKQKLYYIFLKKLVAKMRNSIKYIKTYLKKLRKTLRNPIIKII